MLTRLSPSREGLRWLGHDTRGVRCQLPALSSLIKSLRIEDDVPDMTSLSNIAEANVTPARGVALTGNFSSGLVGRRPGFLSTVFFAGTTRLLPARAGGGTCRWLLRGHRS